MEKIRFKYAQGSAQAAYICDAAGNQDGEYYRAEDVDRLFSAMTAAAGRISRNHRGDLQLLQDEHDALRAVVRDLEKDAARYRWLVRQDFDIPGADRIDDRIACEWALIVAVKDGMEGGK